MSRGAGERPTIVVGAGVAGLTLAEQLVAAGRPVLVLEREPVVGGLARSFRQGEAWFDVGPHRFHTTNRRVAAYLDDVLGDARREVDRRSAVRLGGRTIAWPLGLRSLVALPPGLALRAAWDLTRPRPADGPSFEAWVRHRYGESLYETFFRPYTERFVQHPPSQLSRDWARTGIERALIDGRPAGGLSGLARDLLRPRRELRFLYPTGGGVGRFSERLAQRVRRGGGEIRVDAEVGRVEVADGRVRGVACGDRFEAVDELVWTGPLGDLCRLAGLAEPPLAVLHLILCTAVVEGSPPGKEQWIYVADPELPFSRLSFPSAFDPAAAPEGRFGVCAEIPVRADDPLWAEPVRAVDAVAQGLVRLGVARTRDRIESLEVRRVRDAYPVYTLGYREVVDGALRQLAGIDGLHLLGRGATFWYNNMDHSIAAALALAGRLEAGRDGAGANGR